MTKSFKSTARYITIPSLEGNRFRFFCDISGANVCTTKPIRAGTMEEELKIAWETEGKQKFNFCEKCRRYVSDAMYNADVFQCVDCAPWENPPNFCTHCGEKISIRENYCRKCGNRLLYGEVWK